MAGAIAAASTSAPSSSIRNRICFDHRLPFSRLTPNYHSANAKPLVATPVKLTSSQILAHSTTPPLSRSLPLIRHLFPLIPCRSTAEDIEASIDDGEDESEAESEVESEPEVESEAEAEEQDQEEGVEVVGERKQSNSLDEGRLFVGNLPFSMTSFQLTEIFREAGAVRSAEIIYDRVTDRSRGFAFVTMESLDDAKTAIRMFNEAQVGGRTVRVNFPEVPRGGERKVLSPKIKTKSTGFVDSPHKIYAGNLGWGLTSQGLREVFANQPGFLSAKVVYERGTGRSRGFGFVSFSSAEKAEAAMNSMSGIEVEGRPLRLNTASETSRSVPATPPSPLMGYDDTEQQESSMNESEMVSSSSSTPTSDNSEQQELSMGDTEMVSSTTTSPPPAEDNESEQQQESVSQSEMLSGISS